MRLHPLAILTALTVLAACGGGGGGSPTAGMTPIEPIDPTPMPTTPAVDGTVSVANTAAIDPTAAFRAVDVPTMDGFDVEASAPQSPVLVITDWERHPDSPPLPVDFEAMLARAAHLWTRRITDGGTHEITLHTGHPRGSICNGGIACGGWHPHSGIGLTDEYLNASVDSDGRIRLRPFRVLVHEMGHTLAYRDPVTRTGHGDCASHREQVMCAVNVPGSPTEPNEADFDGIRWRWTVGAPVGDHQDFGMWATVPDVSKLDGFGVSLSRTVTVHENATEYITDTIRLEAEVQGASSAGPAAGLGTATWSGIFLGADTSRFEPVTGDATLTADLEDLATIDLTLSGLKRTNGSGATHPLAAIAYELERHGNAWIDADGRADGRFYADSMEPAAAADSMDPAAAAAGIVSDAGRELAGAWGGIRVRE